MAVAELVKCRVSGPVLGPDGLPVSTGTIRFTLSSRDRDDNISVMPLPVETEFDEEGNFELDLWPNAAGYAGTVYIVTIRYNKALLSSFTAVVPETAFANLADITDLVPPTQVDDATAAAIAAQQALAEILDLENEIGGHVVTLQPLIDNLADAVTVTENIASVVTVAGIDVAVSTVAGIAADVVTVAGIAADVSAVAAVDDAVQSVAANISAVLAAEGHATTASTQAGVATVQAAAATSAMVGAQAAQLGAETAENGAAATKALMDTQLANVTDYSNTLAQLTPAAREIVAAADVVDVAIYDTTLDTDGGAWRKRCNWTSWMKETLGTATRGARNQFPQKALIVARGVAGSLTGHTVTIYDLDQASCPMWMIFQSSGTSSLAVSNINAAITSIAALNGNVYVGTNGTGTLNIWDFISDTTITRVNDTNIYYPRQGIASRNTANLITWINVSPGLVSRTVNDVAATVLPGTPVDRVRKLPTPTVAVATAGGVSVIHWDGRVANSGYAGVASIVAFDQSNTLWFALTANASRFFSPPNEWLATAFASRRYSTGSFPALLTGGSTCFVGAGRRVPFGGSAGLSLLDHRPASGLATNDQSNASAVAYLTSKYSTGYMVGDTKLALAESTADLTSLVQGATDYVDSAAAEKLANPSFTTDLTSWGIIGLATAAWDADGGNGAALVDITGAGGGIQESQTLALNVGKRYSLKVRVKAGTYSGDLALVVAGVTASNFTVTGSYATYEATFTATVANPSISLVRYIAATGTIYVDSFSLKELVTTVFYDDFGGYANDAALDAVYDQNTGSIGAVGGYRVTGDGGLTTNGTATGPILIRTTPLPVGSRVNFELNVRSRADGFVNVYWSGGGGAQINPSGIVVAGITRFSGIVPVGATGFYILISSGSTATIIDSIRVDTVSNDRSVAGNHPVVNGTLTRTAVATGAELAAYGGFSATNYLETGASAITLGTGDFCFSAWAYYGAIGGSIIQETLFSVQGTNELNFEKQSGSTGVRVSQSGRFLGASSVNLLVPNAWNHVVFVRSGSTGYYYINGVLAGTTTMPSYDGALTNGTIRIGNRADGNAFHRQQIALARAGLTAPTPQQIRDMYEAERQLFQANAKCLLPADSVSALAYDDSTDLLHVATTSGMARLKDLLVVDKDAIVVTGIDARSGIVVTRDSNSADAQLPSLLMREELLGEQKVGTYDRDRVRGSAVTVNATPTIIGRIPFDKGEWKIADVRVRANQYADGAAYGRYVRRALVDRPQEGNIALAGSVETMGTDSEGTGTQDIGLTVNTTTQTLDITATGLASTSMEWIWEAVLS